MSSKEGIHVYVRVRPPISDDLNYDTAVHASGNSTVNLSDRKHDVTCDYEHVFPETATQTDVFDTVQPLLNDVLNGYNGCIFAYGQTSAGKTHTMLGKNGGQYLMDYKHEWGLLPRSADYLFKELQKKEHDGSISFKVKCSFLQLYNECIYDLLNNNAPSIANNSSYDDEDIGRKDVGLKIREVSHESRSKKQRKSKQAPSNENMEVYVSGLSEFRVHSASDVITLLTLGSNNRATRATAFNESSSRSHAILTLNFEIEMLQGDANGATTIYRSKLNMVDLAGSEKMYTYNEGNSQFNNSEADGGASAQHVKELTTINKSLHALGNVIATLSSKNYKLQTQLSSNNLDDSFQLNKPTGRIPHIHVPYRDSKLTRLLQDSLGGNTRTILIACVAPTVLHVSETLSTLSFADRAKNVMVKVKANVVVDDKALLARAQAEIIRLKQLLKQALERNNSNCDNSDRIDDDDYQPNLDDIPSMGGSGGGDARYQEMMAMNAQLRKENEELQQKLYFQSVGAGSGIHGKSKKKRAKPLHQRRNEYNGRNPFDSSPLEMNGGGGSTSSIRSSNSGGSTLPQIQRPGLPPQNMKEAGYGYYDNREALRSHSYSGNSNKPNPSNQQSNGADHTHGIARISSPIHVPEDEDAIAVNKLRAKLAKAKTLEQRERLSIQLENAHASNNTLLQRQDAELKRIQEMKYALQQELVKSQQNQAINSEDDDEVDADFVNSTKSNGYSSPSKARRKKNKESNSVGDASPKKFLQLQEQTSVPMPALQVPKPIRGQQHGYSTAPPEDNEESDGELERKLDSVLSKQFNTSPEKKQKKESGEEQMAPSLPVPNPATPAPASNATTPAGLTYTKADVNTAIQMFSFRLNTWEVVTITDFEPNRNLHKISTDQDSKQQWVDLRKKPVKRVD